MTVFPIQVDASFEESAQKSWWKARETLTKDKRFLVASKSFLVKKGVFQSRKNLKSADVIILSRLLDAQGLMITYLENKSLFMKVYDGELGVEIWSKQINLHPSVPVNEQLEKAVSKLVNDFISTIPYQGYVSVDNFIGTPVYEEGEALLVKVDVGSASGVKEGDPAQLIRLTAENFNPLYMGGTKKVVFAEGKIRYIDQNIATIELEKVSDIKEIKQDTLVAFPNEYKRLRDQMSLSENSLPSLSQSALDPSMRSLRSHDDEGKQMASSLGFLGSLALFLIIAL